MIICRKQAGMIVVKSLRPIGVDDLVGLFDQIRGEL